jgi:CCR4-NOT transcription complex subunit 1 CAF1-binding domain
MECTGDEYLPWVAQYLVMKRASIEHNFHTLYANFIDHLKKPEFLTMVVSETYRNIKVIMIMHAKLFSVSPTTSVAMNDATVMSTFVSLVKCECRQR